MRNIYLKSLVITIFTCFAFVSCTSSQNGGDAHSYLPMEETNVVHPLGDTFTVSYTSTNNWLLTTDFGEGDKDWFKVTNQSGKTITSGKAGTTLLNITVSPNISADRQVTLKFFRTEGSQLMDQCDFIQNAAILDMKTPNALTFGWVADKETGKKIDVESNIQWRMRVESDKEEVYYAIKNYHDNAAIGDIDGGFAIGNYTYALTSLEHNMSSSEDTRKATVVIEPVKFNVDGKEEKLSNEVMNALSHKIQVNQEYLIFFITDRLGNELPDALSFSELGEFAADNEYKKILKVTLEKGYDWSSEWKTDDSFSVGMDEVDVKEEKVNERDVVVKTMELKLDDVNPTREFREGCMNFWVVVESDESLKNSTALPVNVRQNPYVLQLPDNSYTFERKNLKNVGDSFDVTFSSSGEWEVIDKPEWVDLDSVVKNGMTTLKVSMDQNLYFEDNNKRGSTDGFAIKSKHNDLRIDLDLAQDPFVFDVAYALEDGQVNPENGIARNNTDDYVVSVTSSGPWTLAMDDVEWLSVESNSGEAGTSYVKVKAEEFNSTELDDFRDANLTFASVYHKNSGLELPPSIKKLPFKQESLRFKIEKSISDSEEFSPASFEAYKGDSKGNAQSSRQSFYLRCSADWEVEVSDGCDWLTVADADGNTIGDKYTTLYIEADTNPYVKSGGREAEFTVVANVGDKKFEKTIAVKQGPFKFEVSGVSANKTYDFKPWNPSSISFDVQTIQNAPWAISFEDADKIVKTKAATRYGNTSKFNIELNNNAEKEKKTATVTIRSTVKGTDADPVTLTLNQAAYLFEVVGNPSDMFEYEELGGSSKPQTIVVKSSSKPQCKVDSWISSKVESTSNTDEYNVSFWPADNYGNKGRESTLTITSANTVFKEDFIVKQSDFVFKANFSDIFEVEALTDTEVTITAECSANLKIEGDVIDASTFNGNVGRGNSRTATVALKPNYETKDKNLSITVTSEYYKSSGVSSWHTATKTIKRKAYVFDTSALNNQDFTYESSSKELIFKCSGTVEANVEGSDGLTVDCSGNPSDGYKLILGVAENKGENERSWTVTVKTKDDSKLTHSFIVKQTGAPAEEKN